MKKSPEQRDHAEVDVIILFDHEEIGSKSAQGADSNLSVELTDRIFKSSQPTATQEDYYRSIRRSFMISADMAHALHPNYSEKHQPSHQPKLQQGIVLKMNANQRYMTDSVGTAIMRTICNKVNAPL